VSGDESSPRTIAWVPWTIIAFGAALFLLGVARFVVRHRFGFNDALHCCLAVVPAGFSLLVFDYVLHHAKLVAVVLLAMVGALAFSSPVVDVAFGLVLMGALAGPALSDWRSATRLRRSTTTSGRDD
jgi:hypothetical protein